MPFEMLIEEAKDMTDEALMEVIHYIQFLKISSGNAVVTGITPSKNGEAKIYRKSGLYKNKIKISEEFDDPLDDFEEYL